MNLNVIQNTTDRLTDVEFILVDYAVDGSGEGMMGVYDPGRQAVVNVCVTPGVHRLLCFIAQNSKEGQPLFEDGKKFLLAFADQVIHGYPMFNDEWCEECDGWIAKQTVNA